MQNKGFVKFIAIALSLICVFYLSFSFVTRHYEQKAEAMGEAAGKAYLDSLRQSEGSVWLGYDYKSCEALQIGLGLDLKGGMNVILEVSVPDVVKNLAGSNADNPQVKQIMNEARAEAENRLITSSMSSCVSTNRKWVKTSSAVSSPLNSRKKVSPPNSTDAQVKADLEKEIKAAVDNSYQVVRQRIDRFGVAQPNIQILEGRGQMGQIMVEMPGIKEPERVRKLLQGSANLEFWETYKYSDVQSALAALDTRLAQAAAGDKGTKADTAKVDSTKKETVADAKASAANALKALGQKNNAGEAKEAAAATNKAREAALKAHPLLGLFAMPGYPESSVVGYATALDTAAINRAVHSELAAQVLPADLNLAWGASAEKGLFELYALRRTDGKAPWPAK